MVREKYIETAVGLFMLAAIIAMLVLAFKVSGLSLSLGRSSYSVTASFANIGNLKPRAEVSLAGVKIGEVQYIELDANDYMAKITMVIDSNRLHSKHPNIWFNRRKLCEFNPWV